MGIFVEGVENATITNGLSRGISVSGGANAIITNDGNITTNATGSGNTAYGIEAAYGSPNARILNTGNIIVVAPVLDAYGIETGSDSNAVS